MKPMDHAFPEQQHHRHVHQARAGHVLRCAACQCAAARADRAGGSHPAQACASRASLATARSTARQLVLSAEVREREAYLAKAQDVFELEASPARARAALTYG